MLQDPKTAIWCTGILLHIVQTSTLYQDAKTFVDLPARGDPNAIAKEFAAQLGGRATMPVQELRAFIDKHFEAPGSDLPVIDIQPRPPVCPAFLARFTSNTARTLIEDIHALWFSLTRQIAPSVTEEPDKHTLVPVPNAFVIPGDRFREAYYWDTYWSIEGMLLTGLSDIAKGIVNNLLHMAHEFGHVPNGNRIYYINRSQPPLLSQMVKAVYTHTNDTAFLSRALTILIKEHVFWSSPPKLVFVKGHDGKMYGLTRYVSDWKLPRPEAYTMDWDLSRSMSDTTAAQFYHDISSTAESGWDFSSRWCAQLHPPHTNTTDLRTIRTTSMIPVDLNAYLYQMERNVAAFAREVGREEVVVEYEGYAEERKRGMQALMWSEEGGQWHDLLMFDFDPPTATALRVEQIQRVYVSNWVPLYAGLTEGDDAQGVRAVQGLVDSGLLLEGGIATSLHPSQQQWDYPNGWPNMQHMMIMGADAYGGAAGKALAKDMATKWLANCYLTYKATGYFWEKYDVSQVGGKGGGGEYEVQKGFGWTNGVIVSLLDKYGDEVVEGLDDGVCVE